MAKSASSERDEKKLNEKIKKDLTESYNVYNSKYKKAKEELATLTNPFKSTMGKFQFKIGALMKKLSTMPELDWNLIGSFACIEIFVKSVENTNGKDDSPFYSLSAILTGRCCTHILMISNCDCFIVSHRRHRNSYRNRCGNTIKRR